MPRSRWGPGRKRQGRSAASGPRSAAPRLGDALATGLDVQRTADRDRAAGGPGKRCRGRSRLAARRRPAAVCRRYFRHRTAGTSARFMDALAARAPFAVTSNSWVLLLGQPPLGAFSSSSDSRSSPPTTMLDALTTFAARAAHALRSSERAHRQGGRARPQPGTGRRRRPGDRAALAGAHAGDGDRPDRRAGRRRPAGGLFAGAR